MAEMKIVEYGKVRVLTTKQLAEAYGTDAKTISQNFNRNKFRYIEDKHFIRLSGCEKTDFINYHQFEDGSNKAKYLYLWTEKGALLHAKSLNTDVAWEVYDRLVDNYFRGKEQIQQLSNFCDSMPPVIQQFLENQQNLMEELVRMNHSISDRLAMLESEKEKPAVLAITSGSKPFTVAENENTARKKKLNWLVTQMAKACGWTRSFTLHRLYKTLEEVLDINIDNYVDLYKEEVQEDVCTIDAVVASENLYTTAIRLCNNTLSKMSVEV